MKVINNFEELLKFIGLSTEMTDKQGCQYALHLVTSVWWLSDYGHNLNFHMFWCLGGR
jgi:hypothetical protein